MFRFGKKAEYALIAMAHMAAQPDARPVSSRELAERYEIPPELLGKVMQSLTRAGLVRSVHGVKGGYRLSRPTADLTVGAVIDAVEGPLRLASCALDHRGCDQAAHCNIRRPVFTLQDRLLDFIHTLPFDQFMEGKTGQITREDDACLPQPPTHRPPRPRRRLPQPQPLPVNP